MTVEDLRKLLAAGTRKRPLPWFVSGYEGEANPQEGDDHSVQSKGGGVAFCGTTDLERADLISAAVNALPLLLDVVEKAEALSAAQRCRCHDKGDDWCAHHDFDDLREALAKLKGART